MKKILIFSFLYFLVFQVHIYSDVIQLSDGKIMYGKIIDKTPTKYIIEIKNETSNISELIEIDINRVVLITHEKTGETEFATDEDNVDSLVIDEKPSKEESEEVPVIPLMDKINNARFELNSLLFPYIDKVLGDKENRLFDILRTYPAEILLVIVVIIFIFFLSSILSKKKKRKKIKERYMKESMPNFDYKPMKEKKLFTNISLPCVTVFYKVSERPSRYKECVCKTVDTEGISMIIDEEFALSTTLKLVIIREKRIGRNTIEENIGLNADVMEIKDAPVDKYYTVFAKFQHMFLSQRAFISKIVEDKPAK
ncbi:MAG: hypothetical protein KAI43_00600 [Candidatus Aureabacteria bacterium]|nr:hypothetical protein [Candidatus Auribacterota bacterium]